MLSRRGRSDHKREEAGRRIPTMPQMGYLGLDDRTLREGSLFGEGLIRDVENWHLREARRQEGVHCPKLERTARAYAKAHKLSMPRARMLVALFGAK